MAIYKFGNIFNEKRRYNNSGNVAIFITTNNVITNGGKLVMGAGIALEAKTRWPSLPKLFADHIKEFHSGKKFYGVIPPFEVVDRHGEISYIGALQTKTDWKKKSSLKLVRKSLRELDSWAISHRGKYIVNCAMPGVTNGQLDFWKIIAACNICCDDITFWHMADLPKLPKLKKRKKKKVK